jgi:hypothetical protein
MVIRRISKSGARPFLCGSSLFSDSVRFHRCKRRLVPTRLPALLERLLRDGLPVAASKLEPTGGRPRMPICPPVYQAVMRVAFRQSHQCAQGAMLLADNLQHNPDGPVDAATLSDWPFSLAGTQHGPLLEGAGNHGRWG